MNNIGVSCSLLVNRGTNHCFEGHEARHFLVEQVRTMVNSGTNHCFEGHEARHFLVEQVRTMVNSGTNHCFEGHEARHFLVEQVRTMVNSGTKKCLASCPSKQLLGKRLLCPRHVNGWGIKCYPCPYVRHNQRRLLSKSNSFDQNFVKLGHVTLFSTLYHNVFSPADKFVELIFRNNFFIFNFSKIKMSLQ